jgi:hypothetical protein
MCPSTMHCRRQGVQSGPDCPTAQTIRAVWMFPKERAYRRVCHKNGIRGAADRLECALICQQGPSRRRGGRHRLCDRERSPFRDSQIFVRQTGGWRCASFGPWVCLCAWHLWRAGSADSALSWLLRWTPRARWSKTQERSPDSWVCARAHRFAYSTRTSLPSFTQRGPSRFCCFLSVCSTLWTATSCRRCWCTS